MVSPTIYPSKNISSIDNFTAGSSYAVSGITLQPAPPSGLTVLDDKAIEEGYSASFDTLHGIQYWTIATDGKTIYAYSSPGIVKGVSQYAVGKITAGNPVLGRGSPLSTTGFLGLGTLGEEIAVIAGVILVVAVIALIVHFRR